MLRVIDLDFNLIGEIDQYDSLQFHKKWHTYGMFSIQITGLYDVTLFKEGNIIFFADNPKKSMVIAHTEFNQETSDTLIVNGSTLGVWLNQRITIPPAGQAYHRVNSSYENIMKQFVNKQAVNPEDVNRKIPKLVIAPNQNRGGFSSYQSRHKVLADELHTLSIASGLGWDVHLDLENEQFVFDVFDGKDVSASQNVNSPVIFSVDFDNISSQKYINSLNGYKNFGYVGGKGEETDREIVTVGNTSGLDRVETFIDARNVELTSDLYEVGNQKLAEFAKVQSFETKILPYSNFIYEQDWNLGDIVTSQSKKLGLAFDMRVTEVLEVYEPNNISLEATFGKPFPTLVETVKRTVSTTSSSEPLRGSAGTDGQDGVGLDYLWQGTSLGIKREDEANYSYVNLQGTQGAQGIQGPQGERGLQGEQGIQGIPGEQGPKGDTGPQGPIGLTGPQGEQGPIGLTGPQGSQGEQGLQGIQGPKGDTPAHQWSGTSLSFENPDGTFGAYVNLKGDKGETGSTGPQGPPGASVADSVEWEKVLNKPSSFPPSIHGHSKVDRYSQYGINNDTLPTDISQPVMRYDFIQGSPHGNYRTILTLSGYSRGAVQLSFPYGHYGEGDNIYWRTHNWSTDTWSEWRKFWHSGNFDPESVKSYHAGASPPANKNLIWIDTSN